MFRRALTTACLALAASAAAAETSAAQTPAARGAVCAPRDQIVQRLADRYGETRKGYGLQSAKLVVELYASDETGTWTLIATRTDGVSCAMAVGRAWRPDDQALLGPPI